MKEIVFVTPTDTKNILRESVGPLLLATILRGKGIESRILSLANLGDMEEFNAFLEEASAKISETKPKIVSFYTRSDCFHIMLKLARAVKDRIQCTVVFGGPQADIVAKQTLAEIPYVDYVCCGEGENTVYPFFSSLLRGEPDLSVDGLVYRKDGEIFMNPRPTLIEDLDTIPLLDYSIFPADSVVDTQMAFPIDVGRGCPFGCTFCSTKTFWGRKYRLKSPKRIVEELQYYYDLFGVRHFVFQHDMFTMNKKLVMETCRLIKELPFKATWNCSARLDCIDKELIDTMADAGLYHIYLGIETGSPRMQKIVNKNLKLDGIVDMIRYLRSKDLQVTTSFIYGFPQETEEDLSLTLALVMELYRIGKVRIQMHRCAFLPGTALFEEYKERLTPTTVFCDMTGDFGVAECRDLIQEHPALFQYYNEYTTELRDKLLYMPVFMAMLKLMPSIYLYLAQKYSAETMAQMYFDFVEKNWQTLTQEGLSDQALAYRVLAKDLYAESFKDDPCAARISQAYRICNSKISVSNGEVPTVTDIFSLSPKELEVGIPLDRCKEGLYMVTFAKDEKGKVATKIRGV